MILGTHRNESWHTATHTNITFKKKRSHLWSREIRRGHKSAKTLQHTLQHTATYLNTLQHTATQCNTLQHTATYCYTLPHTLQGLFWHVTGLLWHVAGLFWHMTWLFWHIVGLFSHIVRLFWHIIELFWHVLGLVLAHYKQDDRALQADYGSLLAYGRALLEDDRALLALDNMTGISRRKSGSLWLTSWDKWLLRMSSKRVFFDRL